jgi:hypothetical protein
MTAKPAAIAVIAAVSVSVIVTATAKASIGAAAVYLSPKREGGFLFSALPGTSGGLRKGNRPGQQQRHGCDNGNFPFFVHLYTPVKKIFTTPTALYFDVPVPLGAAAVWQWAFGGLEEFFGDYQNNRQ